MSSQPNILTVDVEEWFHGHNYLDHVPPSIWDKQESRVEKGTMRCLDLLDRHQTKATFFVLGWTAERFPELIAEVARRGHEIGCHSYAHPEVFKLSRDEFRADCEKALNALAAAGDFEVKGYRAPSFSITPPVHDYLEVLADLGFAYDSSIFPIRHPRYGQPKSARDPFQVNGSNTKMTVVPMPTWRVLGQNLPFSGGGYMRILPWPAYRFLRAMAARQNQPCVAYIHPWELDDFKPQAGQSAATSLRSQGGQGTVLGKLERLLSEGGFMTMGEYVSSLKLTDCVDAVS
ncbi:MAG: polysaccharide deacetylase family protein (PEP-CTERM system associated) [Candidatus Krumholzibacteriia bacterium]